MRPSEVRERILWDHEKLRRRLDRLEDLARSEDASALRAEAREFLEALETHMGWEDRCLVPVLRAADAWGETRCERFAEEHVEQRRTLAHVMAHLEDPDRPSVLVTRELLDLIVLLRDDMVEEESVFLDERLLRDDPVAIDLFTG